MLHYLESFIDALNFLDLGTCVKLSGLHDTRYEMFILFAIKYGRPKNARTELCVSIGQQTIVCLKTIKRYTKKLHILMYVTLVVYMLYLFRFT